MPTKVAKPVMLSIPSMPTQSSYFENIICRPTFTIVFVCTERLDTAAHWLRSFRVGVNNMINIDYSNVFTHGPRKKTIRMSVFRWHQIDSIKRMNAIRCRDCRIDEKLKVASAMGSTEQIMKRNIKTNTFKLILFVQCSNRQNVS